MAKPVHQLTPEDFRLSPIWEYDLDEEAGDERGETWVRPVERDPETDLANKVIGVPVALNNGTRMFACLVNIVLCSEAATREFLTLSLWHNGDWIDLARYFDVDHVRRGPKALSEQIGIPIHEVFPIRYDISEHVQGAEAVVRGVIHLEPTHRLSEGERMALIFETLG